MTPRSRAEVRREEVIVAARGLVAAGGLDALTYAALEQRLGYTRGVITHHFRDRDEIVEAVLASAVAEIDAATTAGLAQRGDAKATLRAVVETKVRGFLQHPEAAAVLVSFWTRTDARAMAVHRALFRRWREEAATLFLERRAPADEEARADALGRGTLLVGAVLGIVTQARFDPEGIDIDATIAAAVACLAPAVRVPTTR